MNSSIAVQADPVATDFSRLHSPRDRWLNRALHEEIIEPDRRIIDTHMHLWRDADGYEYFATEYAQDVAASGHNVEASVYVECGSGYYSDGLEHLRSVGETDFAVAVARHYAALPDHSLRLASRIIGHGDLTIGEKLGELLDAHIAIGRERFRGIRHGAKWDPDPVTRGPVSPGRPGLYREPESLRGLVEVAGRGLLFEASVLHPQLDDVTYMASAVPDCQIVLVHTGSPAGRGRFVGRHDEVFDSWRRSMTALSKCPNVSVKLGGVLLTLANYDFGRAERPPTSDELVGLWRPYIETTVELFGAERCMVSSNFPVEKAGVGMTALWNAFKLMLSELSETDKRAVFSETARRLYLL